MKRLPFFLLWLRLFFIGSVFLAGCVLPQPSYTEMRVIENPYGLGVVEEMTGRKVNLTFSELANEESRLSTGTVSPQGAFQYGPIGAAVSGQTYRLMFDYCRFTSSSPVEISPGVVSYYRWGVGVRVSVDATAYKGGISLGTLSGLGAAASQEEVAGTITFLVYGMSGPGVSQLMPLTVELTQENIDKAIASVEKVKALFDNPGTTIISPQCFAVWSEIYPSHVQAGTFVLDSIYKRGLEMEEGRAAYRDALTQ